MYMTRTEAEPAPPEHRDNTNDEASMQRHITDFPNSSKKHRGLESTAGIRR